MVLDLSTAAAVDPPARDRVSAFGDADPPAIVSVSDIHGHLGAARSALRTLSDHPEYPPVVTSDRDGTLRWADENYVLVFNGDLIDRGPHNKEVLDLVARLVIDAPPGRVRVTLGNHEAIVLTPEPLGFRQWFSGQADSPARATFLESIRNGHVIAAYEGHNVTYAHAGSPVPYDVASVNESLRSAAVSLSAAVGTNEDVPTQRSVLTEYPIVLGVGQNYLKGPGAGLVWLHFDHLPPDAPPQVVGHTRHNTPQRKGSVYCQNIIQSNLDRDGGEGVFLETPESLSAVVRSDDGSVETTVLDRFDGESGR